MNQTKPRIVDKNGIAVGIHHVYAEYQLRAGERPLNHEYGPSIIFPDPENGWTCRHKFLRIELGNPREQPPRTPSKTCWPDHSVQIIDRT